MDLSIIIVSWRVRDLVRENLKAIFSRTKNISFEVFVVDNNSADGTVEMVAREFPQVNLIANNYNAGFARANNQAIAMAQGRYILLLNPDMQVEEKTLEKMVEWMDNHPEAGIAGCRLVNKKGEVIPQVRRFPTLWDQLAIILKVPHIFPGVLNKYLKKDFDYNKEAEVDSLRGSFFMIRRKVIDKIGVLDERFFVWFEEVDFCRRARKAGFKVMYTPCAQCLDYVGKSFSQVKRGKAQRYFRDSMLKYFLKWHPAWQWLILYLAWWLGLLIAWIGDKINLKSRVKT
ncbi:glycosyltransferase family 2 protein [Candidatus Parcubacteria bacterium]|nr:MAG: glycosyltransferase family 2 protein [Candidatus Parcubacteria bacterium]